MQNDNLEKIKCVAIIGCGAAGMIAGKNLRESGFNVTIYEKNCFPGGIWKYRKGDENSVMYNSLRTNLPRGMLLLS